MQKKTQVREFVIDLFCGAGGTSTGVHMSNTDSKVVMCVNHDTNAIESHRKNHPWAKHLIEDIRNPEVLFFLNLRIKALRKLYPNCIITIWASLECTNFSKAKGGLPRKADSRSLATYMAEYLKWSDADYLMIENVIEFMSWGPLDENGKPLSKRKGTDYIKWINEIQSLGYNFDWRELNSADYGAYTSRSRYFAQFAKGNLPIAWPEKTHSKNPNKEGDLFSTKYKKWKAVKEVLDLEDEGNSIFGRKKPLVDNSLKRIYAGLCKFVADGDDSFIQKYFSGRPEGKVISIDGPAGTVKTKDGQSLIKCNCLMKYNSMNTSGSHTPPSVDEPCPTVACQNRLGVTSVNFLQSYYGNGSTPSLNFPCPTLSTKDRFGKIKADFISPVEKLPIKQFMEQQYGKSTPIGIDRPLNTITINPKFSLVSLVPFNGKRKDHYIFNPQFASKGSSIQIPAPTVIARQDKRPLGLVSFRFDSNVVIPIYIDDSEIMIKIKVFMAHHGISDIKMRMLKIPELLQIQGFPKNYKLVGTQTEQKKFIGNSVEVRTAKAIFEAHIESLEAYFEKHNINIAA